MSTATLRASAAYQEARAFEKKAMAARNIDALLVVADRFEELGDHRRAKGLHALDHAFKEAQLDADAYQTPWGIYWDARRLEPFRRPLDHHSAEEIASEIAMPTEYRGRRLLAIMRPRVVLRGSRKFFWVVTSGNGSWDAWMFDHEKPAKRFQETLLRELSPRVKIKRVPRNLELQPPGCYGFRP